MNSLTGTEQRFVLAEIIKSSSVDVYALASFVRSHNVIPDWYNMQLPNGRNLNQCIKFAQSVSIPGLSIQQSSSSHNELTNQSLSDYSRCQQATTSTSGQNPTTVSPVQGHFNIIPRPTNGVDGKNASASPFTKTPAKKRGRPSRSEISRRDLPPRLPPPIAPRPPLPTPGSNVPTPRAILPAIHRALEPQAPVHPDIPSSLSNGPRSRKRRCFNSPTTTPIVNRASTPPPPSTAPSPHAGEPSVAQASSKSQETSDDSNKTLSPDSA